MDLTSAKAKRDARIQAKHEKIKNELGVAPETGAAKAEEVSAPKEVKATKEKAPKTTAPRKAKKESEEKK